MKLFVTKIVHSQGEYFNSLPELHCSGIGIRYPKEPGHSTRWLQDKCEGVIKDSCPWPYSHCRVMLRRFGVM